MKPHIGLSLLLAASLGVAGVASAATSGPPQNLQIRSISVPYDPARVINQDTAETLFFQIRHAAAEVCRIASFPRGYELWYEHACETEAVAEAIDEVNIPALDEFYTGLGGRLERSGSAMPR